MQSVRRAATSRARSQLWSAWLRNGRALPILRIDKSVPLEVARRPVLVHNAETLAQVALVARYGPEWFRRLGTLDAPGSTLVTVTGAVRTPGVLEVEYGTPVDDIVRRAGLDERAVRRRCSEGTAGRGSTRHRWRHRSPRAR
jgi:NADH:ubiquinone oxidoreductase subunit F (NADH-binding)